MRKYGGNDELQSFLLRMVWLGQLKGAFPEAKAAALSGTASQYTRIAAIRAVKAVGGADDLNDIRTAFLSEAPELKRDWLSELVEGCVPTPETASWLLGCLKKTEEKKPYSVDDLSDQVTNFIRAADIELLPDLISGLLDLLRQPPVLERCEISKKLAWLMPAAAQAVERLVEARDPAALEEKALEVLHKLQMGRGYDTEELRDQKFALANLVPDWPDSTEKCSGTRLNAPPRGAEKKMANVSKMFGACRIFGELWRFDENDFDYVTRRMVREPLKTTVLSPCRSPSGSTWEAAAPANGASE